MVGRALMLTPRLLIADEPVSMVDASLRATILSNLGVLKQRHGVSILYITHDLATAYHVSDYVLVIYKGRVVEAGETEVVIKDPRHPYTQLLVSSIPWPDPDRQWGATRPSPASCTCWPTPKCSPRPCYALPSRAFPCGWTARPRRWRPTCPRCRHLRARDYPGRGSTRQDWSDTPAPPAYPRAGRGEADAVGLRHGGGVEADPIALRRAVQGHREVRIHEGVASVIEHDGDAAGRVGHDEQALQRRGGLAGHQRHAAPHPGRHRALAPATRAMRVSTEVW